MNDTIRKFYSQFNNRMFVLCKGSREINTIRLMTTYRLLALTYGIEMVSRYMQSFCDYSK